MCYLEIVTENREHPLFAIHNLNERQVIVLQTALENLLNEVKYRPNSDKSLFLSDIERIHSELKKL